MTTATRVSTSCAHTRTRRANNVAAAVCSDCMAILPFWSVWIPKSEDLTSNSPLLFGKNERGRLGTIWWTPHRKEAEKKAEVYGGKVVSTEWLAKNLDALKKGEVKL